MSLTFLLQSVSAAELRYERENMKKKDEFFRAYPIIWSPELARKENVKENELFYWPKMSESMKRYAKVIVHCSYPDEQALATLEVSGIY
jgi:hypothetical protein